jgi:hypothetical protein
MNQHLERLNGLAGFLQPVVLELMTRCARDLKRPLLVVRGWSSYAEQLGKYQQGRTLDRESGEWVVTQPPRVVTQAKPGLSAHNVVMHGTMAKASVGVDLIPLLDSGQPDWQVSLAFWDQLYPIAWKCGLDPLGDRVGAYLQGDLGHFEEPGWKLKLQGLGLMQPVGDEPVGV